MGVNLLSHDVTMVWNANLEFLISLLDASSSDSQWLTDENKSNPVLYFEWPNDLGDRCWNEMAE